jgi:hypothetical protein
MLRILLDKILIIYYPVHISTGYFPLHYDYFRGTFLLNFLERGMRCMITVELKEGYVLAAVRGGGKNKTKTDFSERRNITGSDMEKFDQSVRLNLVTARIRALISLPCVVSFYINVCPGKYEIKGKVAIFLGNNDVLEAVQAHMEEVESMLQSFHEVHCTASFTFSYSQKLQNEVMKAL